MRSRILTENANSSVTSNEQLAKLQFYILRRQTLQTSHVIQHVPLLPMSVFIFYISLSLYIYLAEEQTLQKEQLDRKIIRSFTSYLHMGLLHIHMYTLGRTTIPYYTTLYVSINPAIPTLISKSRID